MNLDATRCDARQALSTRSWIRTSRRRLVALSFSTLGCTLLAGIVPATALGHARLSTSQESQSVLATASSSRVSSALIYPTGVSNGSEPSGDAPPLSSSLEGYRESYVNDFSGTTLPPGWSAFAGTPGGDQGSLWARSHVVVNGGILQLNASQDPAFANAWVTGGVAQSAVANTYGAYFVRSKMTGAGATQVEMLWPTSGWPPEIDFNETRGGDSSSIATLHYGSSNLQDYRSITIDMTQWHTWGVIWSPSSVTYTVDGRVWGAITVASEIPSQPMTLDITQQTWCSWGFACPTSPESTEVDWVAEYKASSASSESVPTTAPVDTVAVSPFAPHSAILSVALKVKISRLANVIKANGDSKVRLVGYGDAVGSRSANVAVSRARALSVKSYLTLRLAALGVTGVSITMTIKATPEP